MTGSQKGSPPHILLVGNPSYQNRGAEAIVRGTLEILRREFGSDIRARAGVYATASIVREQSAAEADAAVRTFCLDGLKPRWSRVWWEMQANKRLGTSFVAQHWPLIEHLSGACVALELGGDNYSIYHNKKKPERFMAVDRFLQKRGIPVVLWGASVGPFDADPVFAPFMFEHLRSLGGIFVRESDSLEYLRANAVTENVHLVADPAFVMKPVKPPPARIGFPLPEGAIGINLSPMLAFYRGRESSAVDLDEWLGFCVRLIKSVAVFKRPILLIAHVFSADPANDDFGLLHRLCKAASRDVPVPVQVLPDRLSAAEIKWVISRCTVFAGARTHSTIAALSSQVPTLSIAYSLKAKGINRDIYGNLDYCINVADLTPANLAERLEILVKKESGIRAHLQTTIPKFQSLALSAGPLLREVITCPEGLSLA
jgi:polysaccharide pyruvyl transferase WcaK-like protein